MPLTRPSITAGAITAFLALCGTATASSPVSVAPLRPCYVSVAKGSTEPVMLSATGFHPHAAVDVRLNGRPVATVTVGGDGRLDVRVNLPHHRRGRRTFVLKLEQRGDPSHRARVSARVTALGVNVRPAAAPPQSVVTWKGSGFTADGPVYVHYVKDGVVRHTTRLTAPRGACGAFRIQRPQFPFRPSMGTWTLQIDQQRTFAQLPATSFVQLPVRVRRVGN